jgi:hypothetical protein
VPPPPPPAPEIAPPPPPAPAYGQTAPTGTGERLPLGAGAVSASDDKLYCILNQFLALIIWLWKKDESPAVNLSGKEALNFHITALIAQVGLWIASLIPFVGCLTVPISFLAGLGTLVLCIIGALKTSDGYFYKYPINLRLIK